MLCLSAIVIQELEIGILLLERRDPAQGEWLRDWLEDQVLSVFDNRILPVDLPDCAASRRHLLSTLIE